MHLPRFVSVFLTTLLLVSVINYSPNPTNKLADDNSNDYVLGQGKRSKSPVMLTANNDNYTLNESNQWIWLEFTASSDLAWVNLSFENYDSNAYGQSIYLQVFNHYSRCISSSVGVYSWATLNSLCQINSVDKTILILVDLSNNGNRDWDYGNVSISLNIESYQAPPVVDPQVYQYPDEGLDADSTYYNPINAFNSATGYFETDSDYDYFTVDVALNGIYQVNVTYDINLTVQRYAGDSDCDNGVISNTSTQYITCYTKLDYVTFSINNATWQSFVVPEIWSVEIEILEVRPIEDDLHGDAPSYNSNQQLRNGDVSIDATFMDAYDTDWYSLNIEHGFDQQIYIISEQGASLNFADISKASQYCILVTNADNKITSQVTIVAGIATQLICETNHFLDELDFSIVSSDYNYNSGNNYTLTLSKVENNSGLGVSDSSYVLDAPPRNSNNLLNQGVYGGGFLYPSDTKDQYSVIIPANSITTVTVESDCAMIQGSSPSYDRIFNRTFLNNDDEEDNFELVIQRIEQLNSNLPFNLYPNCLYDFKISHQSIFQSWQPTLTGRLSLVSDVIMLDQINERTQSIANGSTPGTTAMTFIDIVPNEIATITATQSSGTPLFLMADGNKYISGEGEVQIAGMIEVGRQFVSWQSLHLYGIDGSAITISMTLSSTQLLTDEVNEIKSMATGYLGISNDEGYDNIDTWRLNNSDDASMISVRITEVDPGLEVQINGGISNTFCSIYGYNPSTGQYENYFDDVIVNLNKGSGKYTLRVDKLYGECISTYINSPSTAPAGATIKINGNIYNSVEMNDQVNYQLVSQDLEIVASTEIGEIGDYTLMTIPTDIEGSYYLQTIHRGAGFLLDSTAIYISNYSINSATEIHQVLDLDEHPGISIDTWLPYNHIPSNWTLQNIQFYQETFNGTEFLQTFENISANGLEKIEFELDSKLKQGTRISMQAELIIDDTMQMISFSWIRGLLILETECQTSIQPVVGEPESDLICTIEGHYSQLYSSFGGTTISAVSGTLVIYGNNGTMLESHEFTLQNGIANIRIPTWHFYEDEYYAVAYSGNASNTTSIMNRIDNFFVDETLDPESDYSDLGIFEFSAYSIKQNAMAGDEITIQWHHNGEPLSSIRWSLTSGLYQDGASFAVEDRINNGSFSIVLPERLISNSVHHIYIEAYSIYGQVQSENIYIYGADNGPDVFVDINPQRPSTGEEFTVTITAPSANEWLRYSWTLTHNSAILNSGTGWVGANEASFKVVLPVMHFTSDVILTVISEDHSGMLFSDVVTIQPIPLREIHVNTDEYGVSGKMFEFAFSIKGEQLNSIDSVKSARVRIISMTDVVIQEELFIINSKNGQFTTLVPANTAPGTYLLEIEFELLDGGVFNHRELLTILSQEEGVSVFGLVTIPSLPHGIDTIIVAILALFLLTKGGNKLRLKRRNKNIDFDSMDDDDYEVEKFADEDLFAGSGFTPIPPKLPQLPVGIKQSEIKHDDNSQSPQYETQEYPLGSGHWWERNSAEEDWQKI